MRAVSLSTLGLGTQSLPSKATLALFKLTGPANARLKSLPAPAVLLLCTLALFVKNQLSPNLISLSPLLPIRTSILQHTRIRPLIPLGHRSLTKSSSSGFGSNIHNSKRLNELAMYIKSLAHHAKGTLSTQQPCPTNF